MSRLHAREMLGYNAGNPLLGYNAAGLALPGYVLDMDRVALMNIQDVLNDSFSLPLWEGGIHDLKMQSLKLALKAYFSTYKSIYYRIDEIIEGPSSDSEQAKVDSHLRDEYFEAYSETILHFHHFIELVLKDVLRSEHELLANDAGDKHLILFKLLTGEPVSQEDKEKTQSIQFGKALDRVVKLIDSRKLPEFLNFVKQARASLDNLNERRNRVWHRGTVILRYKALDLLVGKYILPIIIQILNLEMYKGKERQWKHPKLHCGKDPIEEIVLEFQKDKPNYKRAAFFKELGRASYESPIAYDPSRYEGRTLGRFDVEAWDCVHNEEHSKRAERIATEESKQTIEDVRECPVCGVKSLILYSDVEYEDYDGQTGQGIGKAGYRNLEAKCWCCSFTVDCKMPNPRECGIDIEDYWKWVDLK